MNKRHPSGGVCFLWAKINRMSYLVLARKWRPRSFDTLVGQDHVVRALTNALDTQRLHHAWLFTGTRGVGKTTLSRILAKSLNCETGITSKPCGVCRACVEIDEGRFVDYLEFDAASNRRVEEMTQLLEQAVYAPSSGRYKIYMIDEVHMLSGHAFNAMLKTLEEPPPHIKFILATTDPQKMPVTVLSRCLQFNLKQMPPDAIVSHLNHVLGEEQVGFEVAGLRQIAQAAAGSMRDALSLTDQAIAFSGANITAESVRDMLGTIDQRFLIRLLDSLHQGSAQGVVDIANELYARGYSFGGALSDLAVLLSQIAIEQRLPGTALSDAVLHEDIVRLARTCHPDALQLFYSIAVHGRNELSLAPDEYAGFVMTCLRMLSLVTSEPAHSVAAEWHGGSAAGQGHKAASADAAPIQNDPVEASQKKNLTEHEPKDAAMPASPQYRDGGAARGEAGITAVAQAPAGGAVAETAIEPQAAAAASDSPVHGVEAGSTPAGKALHPVQWNDATPAWEYPPGAEPVAQAGEAAALTPAPAAIEPMQARAVAPQLSPKPAAGQGASESAGGTEGAEPGQEGPPVWEDIPPDWEAAGVAGQTDDDGDVVAAAPAEDRVDHTWVPARAEQVRRTLDQMNAREWVALVAELRLSGYAAEMTRRCEWIGRQQNKITLRIPVKGQNDLNAKTKLETALTEYFQEVVRVDMAYGQTGDDTLHAVQQAEREALQQQVEKAVQENAFINGLIADLGARVVPGSIEPFKPKAS